MVLLVAPRAAQAQNPRSVPIGGRTATMGGAGTAAGNDSAMPYLNPAGLAGLPGDVFGVSASVYQYETRSFQGLFAPRGVNGAYGSWSIASESYESATVSELPTSVMYVRHLPSQGSLQHLVAMSLIVPSRTRTEIRANTRIALPTASGFIDENISASTDTTDYYVGPSYALALGEHFRLGVSAYVLYAQAFHTWEFSDFTSITGGTTISKSHLTAASRTTAVGFVPVLGAQLEVAPKFWLGAGVAAPSFHLFGHEKTQNNASTAGPSGTPSGVVVQEQYVTYDGDLQDRRPLRANFGVAYDDRSAFSAALDVSVFAGLSGANRFDGTRHITQFQSGEVPRQIDDRYVEEKNLDPVVELAAGVEYAFSPIIAVRAGGFSDLPNTPALDQPTGGAFRIRENRYGASLGLGTTLGSFDSTLGLVYEHGEGQIVTLDVLSTSGQPFATAPTKSDTIIVVFSGAVTFEQAKKTIEEHSPVQVEPPSAIPFAPPPAATPAPAPVAPPPAPAPPPPAPAPEAPAPPAAPVPPPVAPAPEPAPAPAPVPEPPPP